MLLRQKLFPLSIIRTAKCDKKEWPAKGYWANRWTGPKSSLPVPQWTGPLSVGACAENGSPFPSLHQSSAAPLNFADCDFPSKHHFLFYTVDSCRCSLQLQNVWALQWWGLWSSESTTQTTFRLQKTKKDTGWQSNENKWLFFCDL